LAKKTAAKKILDWLFNIIVALAVLLVAFMFLAPRYGINMHPVLSGSMEPALKVGGVVVTRLIRVDEVKKGDVISYKIGEQRITHRVIEVNKQADGKINFQTKGDANEEPDPYAVVPKTEKVPKVVLYIPYFGFLAGFLKHKTNFFLLVGIPSALLVALYIWDIWREARKTRRAPVNWKSRV
jgi:signal peptidase